MSKKLPDLEALAGIINILDGLTTDEDRRTVVGLAFDEGGECPVMLEGAVGAVVTWALRARRTDFVSGCALAYVRTMGAVAG